MGLLCVADHSLVADRELVTSFGATAGEYGPAVLRLHSFAEAVRLCTVAVIRLKRTFWHVCLILRRQNS